MYDTLLVASWSDGRPAQRIALFGQRIHIGHDPYCDVIMPPEFTPHSAYHATIHLQDQACYINDPLNTHTIYLNGARLVGQGILAPEMTAYVGHPNRAPLYLRLQLEVTQFTQMVQTSNDLGMTALARSIGTLPPNLPEHITPYVMMSWSKDDYQTHDLDQEVVIVGRSATANIVLPAQLKFISSLHFQIIKADDHFFVQDKDSTNGTRLNRNQLEPHKLYRLVDGDIINIQTPQQLVWFIFHDPINPNSKNLARQAPPEPVLTSGPTQSKPLSLWERIRQFLTSRS